MGFMRAVTIEQLDPNLNASVEASGGVRARTRTRYERTMRYFALVASGDTATATKAADILVKVHSKGIGIDPVTGGRYDSNSPESQLWIHMTAWHSILYCYEIFGPGKLSEEEETQYWAECAIAAQCQTINPDDVPRSREAVIEFFDDWRPRLAAYAMRALMTAVNSNMHLYDAVWSWLVPGTAPIMMPAALGIPALSDVTMTPREAQKKYGYDIPSEAHMDLRRKQEQRVFGSHEAPSDEGLIESEAFFGGMKGVVAATG